MLFLNIPVRQTVYFLTSKYSGYFYKKILNLPRELVPFPIHKVNCYSILYLAMHVKVRTK